MKITVNGENMEVQRELTVMNWLEQKKVALDVTVVELNGQIVPPENWAETVLQDEDKLEVLVFIGGG